MNVSSCSVRFILSAFFTVLGSSFAGAADWSGSCQVSFAGKSTLHDFVGKVSSERFVVSVANLENPTQARASAAIKVKAAKMDTDDKKRDQAMRKALEAEAHPTIRVLVENLVPEQTKPKLGGAVPQPTVIPFVLQIKGKKLEVLGTVSDWSYASDRITYTVRFPVSLKQAEVKPPSVLGILKVDDRIDVTAKVTLVRK